ncbi:MAG TPA: DUF5723 family protein [Prolixibacteraceae bacterium]|jgi:hypothetical protein
MKNSFIKLLIVSLIGMLAYSSVSAQENTTLYFMKGISQSDLQNPALHNDSSKVVLGLPGLSGIYLNANSAFAVHDLFHKGTGLQADLLVTDIETFHRAINTNNAVEENFSLPLFHLSLRIKKSFFSLAITEKQSIQTTFAKSLVTFIKDGNAPYIGKNYDLGDIGMNAIHYREFALGYSNELIKNKLTLGLKVKALYGESAFQTQRMNLQVETAADVSYLNLRSDMKINLAGPVTPEYDADNYFSGMNSDNLDVKDYLLQSGNRGMAFDVGAVYNLTPKISFSGSIIDMGKISFKNDVTTLSYVYNYKWEGIDFSKSLNESKADYVDPGDLIEAEMKKVGDSFKPKKSEFGSKAFEMTLPTKIYLGGTYQFSSKFNVGLLNRMYRSATINRNTLTLSGNALIGNFFSLTGTYSIMRDSYQNNSYNNLGLGMTFRMGSTQLYMVSDNLLAMRPSRAEFTNISFGFNFLFGRKKSFKA